MKPKPKRREVWIASGPENRGGGLSLYAFSEEGNCREHIMFFNMNGWTPIRFVEAPKRRRKK